MGRPSSAGTPYLVVAHLYVRPVLAKSVIAVIIRAHFWPEVLLPIMDNPRSSPSFFPIKTYLYLLNQRL